VLILTDPVDEIWVEAVPDYDGKKLQSIARGSVDLPKDAEEPEPEGDFAPLLTFLKEQLTEQIKDVRLSHRLTDSVVCLVADEGDLDMRLARLLQQHKRLDALSPRVLEINGSHPVVAALATAVSGGKAESVADAAWVLLDQARIQEGETLPDPSAFAKRLGEMMGRAFG
jgi:molecular chaperone HtpG